MRHIRRLIFGAGLAAALPTLAVWCWPMPASLDEPTHGTLTLLDARGREIAQLASADARVQLPRTIRELGPWLPRITVALEDRRFFRHHGLDFRAIASASASNVRSGRIVSGASTITQQLAKMARGRQYRSWFGKIDEAIVAWKLERRWNKEQILAEYLNRSSYGNRRLGPEAAARAYFNKSARDLTLAESIFLAGLPQAPTRFNPWTHAGAASSRYTRSLKRLADLRIITVDQEQLLANAIPVAQRLAPPRLAPHFIDAIAASHPKLRGVVRTSLDLDLQHAAERAVHDHLAALNRRDIAQAAVVILENQTGAVRAMVGSGDYDRAQINGATQPRSCGSTLKPFVYASALDRRLFTATSLLPDTADAIRGEYADYDPQNFNHRYLGPVRLREALGCSLNVPAVFAVSRLGARATFFELQKWGFRFSRSLDDYGAGFVLGNAEVRLVDLAAAYAGLARSGVAAPAKLLASDQQRLNRTASAESAAIITDILCDNRARERSFGQHSPLAFDERIAVKTGTSSGFRDAWTVGFDKEHTVAVWIGNFDGRPMRDTFAVRSAAPLWAAIMRDLLRNGDHALDPPHETGELVRCTVCADTGLLPSRFTKTTVDEWFLKGTEPSRDSTEYFSNDGALLLPDEYAGWCATSDNNRGARVRPVPRILNPVANARYEIDSALPLTQQMIELTATLGREIRWFMNDQPIAPARDGRVFWQLARGEWTVRVTNGDAQIEQSFSVE